MRLIQFIIIPALALLMLVYFRRFRTLLWDRLIVLFFGGLGIVMVLRPGWTDQLARDLGVGRGADLMIYFGFVVLGFFCLTLWSKMRDMEARLTLLVRTQAIKDGEEPSHGQKDRGS